MDSERTRAFFAELDEVTATGQADVISAKVPIGSYGRVKDVFDRVKLHTVKTSPRC